jgi:hypothetical protein
MHNGLDPKNLNFIPTKRSFHFLWSCGCGLVLSVIFALIIFGLYIYPNLPK